jgi:Rad3-related DNA helicase
MKELISKAEPQYTSLQTEIDALQKKYMAQQMETDKDKEILPGCQFYTSCNLWKSKRF